MRYIVEDFKEGDRQYSINYTDLEQLYHKFIALSDADFMQQLPEIIHFACICGWFKNLSIDNTIGDCGIVHELVHLLINGNSNKYHFRKVRKQFKFILKLA